MSLNDQVRAIMDVATHGADDAQHHALKRLVTAFRAPILHHALDEAKLGRDGQHICTDMILFFAGMAVETIDLFGRVSSDEKTAEDVSAAFRRYVSIYVKETKK